MECWRMTSRQLSEEAMWNPLTAEKEKKKGRPGSPSWNSEVREEGVEAQRKRRLRFKYDREVVGLWWVFAYSSSKVQFTPL